jgi:hypothetical protein
MRIVKRGEESSATTVNDVEAGQTFRYNCDGGNGPLYMMVNDEDGNNRIVNLCDGEAYDVETLDDGSSSPITIVDAHVVA